MHYLKRSDCSILLRKKCLLRCVCPNSRVSFGFEEPLESAEQTMKRADSKLQGMDIFDVEIGTMPFSQVLSSTLAKVTLLKIVSPRPISFNFT